MSYNNIYYKVLNKDMKSTTVGFQYELNKKYKVEDSNLVELGIYGFHACKNMYELIIYCNFIKLKNCRFFKCTIDSNMGEDKRIIASNSITLIEELDSSLVIKEIEDHLNELINDPEWLVRTAAAYQGYGLGILINDPDPEVRIAVARQGYGLDILINDPDWHVRYTVAGQGYGLDKLIKDPECLVRIAVARQGYGLDILINDPDWIVTTTALYAKDKIDNGGNINE